MPTENKICIRAIQSEVQLGQFDCNNGSVEQKIRGSYFASLIQQGCAYEICLDNTIIGYYMIVIDNLRVCDLPNEVKEYDCVLGHKWCAFRIDFLAIHKKYQHKGIGKKILNSLIARLRIYCNELPIRFIIIDAIEELRSWYTKRGFCALGNSEVDDGSHTIRMYIDCLEHPENIEKYFDE